MRQPKGMTPRNNYYLTCVVVITGGTHGLQVPELILKIGVFELGAFLPEACRIIGFDKLLSQSRKLMFCIMILFDLKLFRL
jgi:hypothetical protein